MVAEHATYCAALRGTDFTQIRVDAENGVVFGVKIAELGKTACFAGHDGKPRSIVISPEHVNAFLAHAGNRSIPVHWTHDYLDQDRDALHDQVGVLKNIRKDDAGNPVGDLYVSPGEYKAKVLWNATHNDTGMMLSAVFKYGAEDSRAIPQNFMAADLVETGAATNALFSKPKNPEITMTKEELQTELAAFKTEVLDTVKAALAEATPKAEMSAEDLAAMEAAEGVTDEDKKPEDDNLPAAMASFRRIGRAQKRTNAAAIAAMAETAAVAAEAKIVSKIGTGTFQVNPGNGNETDPVKSFDAKVTAALSGGAAKSQGQAIALVARQNPELYNQRMAAIGG